MSGMIRNSPQRDERRALLVGERAVGQRTDDAQMRVRVPAGADRAAFFVDAETYPHRMGRRETLGRQRPDEGIRQPVRPHARPGAVHHGVEGLPTAFPRCPCVAG